LNLRGQENVPRSLNQNLDVAQVVGGEGFSPINGVFNSPGGKAKDPQGVDSNAKQSSEEARK